MLVIYVSEPQICSYPHIRFKKTAQNYSFILNCTQKQRFFNKK